jgi:hypothetical protein
LLCVYVHAPLVMARLNHSWGSLLGGKQ